MAGGNEMKYTIDTGMNIFLQWVVFVYAALVTSSLSVTSDC